MLFNVVVLIAVMNLMSLILSASCSFLYVYLVCVDGLTLRGGACMCLFLGGHFLDPWKGVLFVSCHAMSNILKTPGGICGFSLLMGNHQLGFRCVAGYSQPQYKGYLPPIGPDDTKIESASMDLIGRLCVTA